jgi:hypothetical protein
MTVSITRLDILAAALKAAAGTQNAKGTRRVPAIALLLEGYSREALAEACAMDRQTLRNWMHNESGVEGLSDRLRAAGGSYTTKWSRRGC